MYKNVEIKENLYDLYASYSQHRALFNYWKEHRTMKTKEDVVERINYIRKNKINNKNELETLLWVLGEEYKSEEIND